MVKKAGKQSNNSHSPASTEAATKTVNRKKSLKVSPEKMKRPRRSNKDVEKHNKTCISPKKSKPTTKKKSVNDDPKKPKKPPTAFFYFLEDFRKEYQEQNPDVKQMRDIGKACGEKWKTMKYEEKVKYFDMATEKRAEFDKATAEYERKKETGEDQDHLEDSEFDDY